MRRALRRLSLAVLALGVACCQLPLGDAPKLGAPELGYYYFTGDVFQLSFSGYPAGATVHYTLDGADPTTASTAYAGPVGVTVPSGDTIVVKAFSACDGYTPSDIMTKSVTH